MDLVKLSTIYCEYLTDMIKIVVCGSHVIYGLSKCYVNHELKTKTSIVICRLKNLYLEIFFFIFIRMQSGLKCGTV